MVLAHDKSDGFMPVMCENRLCTNAYAVSHCRSRPYVYGFVYRFLIWNNDKFEKNCQDLNILGQEYSSRKLLVGGSPTRDIII